MVQTEIDASKGNLDLLSVVAEARVKKARMYYLFFMGLTIFSLFFNILFVLTMLQMGSKLTVMTQLFNITRGTQSLVLTDVLNRNLGDLELLQKSFVHRFVEERNFRIPDKLEMFRRWNATGTLAIMASRGVWRPARNDKDKRISDLLDLPATHADNVNIISHVGNTWLVDFDLWEHTKSGSTKKRQRVSLVVKFSNAKAQKVASSNLYYNPLGLVVTDYHIVTSTQ